MRHNSENLLSTRHRFFVSAAHGSEPFTVEELEQLGVRVSASTPGGVFFDAPFDSAMKACLWLRSASKVLLRLGEFRVRHEHDVYDAVRSLPLGMWFSADHTICVRSHASDRAIRNSHFLSLRIKDAIVDDLRERFGRRPSVDTDGADVEVVAHVVDGNATLYLGLQGQPLNQRGYRKVATEAPLKETLAASLLRFSGWAAQRPLLDPLCGSGTISIEAALMATNTAPGLGRRFGFERWPRFDAALQRRWHELREEARAAVRPCEVELRACDLDLFAIRAARVNAVQAGVGHCIAFSQSDFSTFDWGSQPLDVLANPPYGLRLGAQKARLAALHAKLGDKIRAIPGATLSLLSTPELLRQTHLKPEARVAVFNGPLRCEMARYQIRAQSSELERAPLGQQASPELDTDTMGSQSELRPLSDTDLALAENPADCREDACPSRALDARTDVAQPTQEGEPS